MAPATCNPALPFCSQSFAPTLRKIMVRMSRTAPQAAIDEHGPHKLQHDTVTVTSHAMNNIFAYR